MKKMLMAAALATSAVTLAAPAYADHGSDAHSGNHWGSAGPAVCAAEDTVAPVLGKLASAPLNACAEGENG
ncbi:hypothetical protein [Streptomyces sp. NPDC046909]|uniref:hypothetical protein n=1 Tax=Streptomyces sp. NPDC046909 TaxID=3155617 RepID=UPI0033FBFC77